MWAAAGGPNALDRLAGEAVEVGVARRDVAVQVRNVDDRLGEILVEEPDGPKHGAIRRTAGAAGGGEAVTWSVGGHGGSRGRTGDARGCCINQRASCSAIDTAHFLSLAANFTTSFHLGGPLIKCRSSRSRT